MTGDPDRSTGDGRDEALEHLVRALEVGSGARLDKPPDGPTAAEIAADRAAILARFRAATGGTTALAGSAHRRRVRSPRWGEAWRRPALGALLVLLLLVVLLPANPALLILLFVGAPLVAVAAWTWEAHHGPELDRHGAVLGERARRFRRAQQDLDDLLTALDGDGAPAPGHGLRAQKAADLRSGVVLARDALAELAARLETGGGSARWFAADWSADPDACTRDQDALGALAPDDVRGALADLLARLHRLGPMAADVALASAADDPAPDPRERVRPATSPAASPSAVADRIEAVHRDVVLARGPVVAECERLWRSFDTVHRTAARCVLAGRTRRATARALSLALLVTPNLSTLSPVTRTRRRTAYVSAVTAHEAPSVVDVGRAVFAMSGV